MSIKKENVGFNWITFDTRIIGGQACIRGMRIPVSIIVRQIAHIATHEEILEGYPDLQRQDIEQAMRYAAWLRKEWVAREEAALTRNLVTEECRVMLTGFSE